MKYYSQIGQDQYYIENVSNFKTNGFFLDVGANDGVHTSNTATLEFELGWKGICVEANPNLIGTLRTNRPNSIIVQNAVWNSESTVEFEVTNSNHKGIEGHLLSRISNLDRNEKYFRKHFEEDKQTFSVQAKTITSILKEHYHLPCVIDFCSIDTEGAELEALQGIDFSQIDINFITIEHGNRPGYVEMFKKYLDPHGYQLHRINEWDVEFIK